MEKTKIGLGLVLMAPMVPMLFMGEEYAASTPFLYFADHEDEAMAKLVSEGRRREFADFGFDADEIPNPEDPTSFTKSKLDWSEVEQGIHAEMHAYVRSLVRIRRRSVCLNDGDRRHMKVTFSDEQRWFRMDRGQVTVIANLGDEAVEATVSPDHRLLLC